MKNKCFIGLGTMGFPIAGHISNNGYRVKVFNRSEEKSSLWLKEFAGESAVNAAEAAQNCDMVFICVGNDNDVEDVVLGSEGVLKELTTESVIVDHTTTSSVLARKIEKECLKKGVFFIDAPVSGGEVGARTGNLTVMAGGNNDAFNRVRVILDLYSRYCKWMGKSGAGQLTKMVNQICIAGLIQGLAEGMDFSERAGLSTKDVIKVITQGAAQSWQMENRWETMLKDDYRHGFAVDWMRKDLGIALSEADRNGSSLELVKLIDTYYSEIQADGGGRWDTSSLFKRLQGK